MLELVDSRHFWQMLVTFDGLLGLDFDFGLLLAGLLVDELRRLIAPLPGLALLPAGGGDLFLLEDGSVFPPDGANDLALCVLTLSVEMVHSKDAG